MNKESILDINYLKAILFYEESTGNFFWLEEKQGRDSSRPAGTRSFKGYRSINVDGIIYSTNRLAWFYMTGEWPTKEIGYKDGNPNNCRWNNLGLISNEERLYNYKLKNETLNKPNLIDYVGKYKARFTDEEVTAAVEEFIKDKVLVGGRYIAKG